MAAAGSDFSAGLASIHLTKSFSVVARDGVALTRDDIITFLDGRVSKWWLPDDVVFIDEVPKTSVGKFSKKTLRERFADYVLPEN